MDSGRLRSTLLLGTGIGAVAVMAASVVAFKMRWWPLQQIQHEYQPHNIPIQLMSSPYVAELKIAIECALTAGCSIKNAMNNNTNKNARDKGANTIDFVTDVDTDNEKYIFDKLRQNFPKHNLVGEVWCTIIYYEI